MYLQSPPDWNPTLILGLYLLTWKASFHFWMWSTDLTSELSYEGLHKSALLGDNGLPNTPDERRLSSLYSCVECMSNKVHHDAKTMVILLKTIEIFCILRMQSNYPWPLLPGGAALFLFCDLCCAQPSLPIQHLPPRVRHSFLAGNSYRMVTSRPNRHQSTLRLFEVRVPRAWQLTG